MGASSSNFTFVDKLNVSLCSGNGGPGCTSFRREAKVPRGGPDGGDGGKGGNVIISGDPKKRTLLDFRYKRKFNAKNGLPGSGAKMYGKRGDDIILPVPLGTQIISQETGELLLDVVSEGDHLFLEGGKGGLGNYHFRNSRNQAPDYSQPGIEGECVDVTLELKLLADVGLVGFPNAGKSTLISVLSNAKPKVGAYPFTTLNPQIGILEHKHKEVSIADLPGLIEGASEGVGLGHKFLRHAERTKFILHLISVDPNEEFKPFKRYEMIRKELDKYKSENSFFEKDLSELEELVVLTKLDLTKPLELLNIEKEFRDNDLNTISISSVAHRNVDELKDIIINKDFS